MVRVGGLWSCRGVAVALKGYLHEFGIRGCRWLLFVLPVGGDAIGAQVARDTWLSRARLYLWLRAAGKAEPGDEPESVKLRGRTVEYGCRSQKTRSYDGRQRL